MARNTPNVFRLDEKVFIFMVSLILLSSLILAFRYKNTEPCEGVTMSSSAVSYVEGAMISFRADTKNGHSYLWDFGDGQVPVAFGSGVHHIYKAPGTYLVTVEVNGHCEAIDTVRIGQAAVVVNASLQPDFIAPAGAKINEPVTVSDTTADATNWEWRFGENETVYDRARQTTYTFKTPGWHIIILKINGRSDRVSSRPIYVEDARPLIDKKDMKPVPRNNSYPPVYIPSAPTVPPHKRDTATAVGPANAVKPGPVKATPVEADEMILLLQSVVTGEKKFADFLPYFCGEPDIPVIYNGTKMKFSQMCVQLRKFGKLKKIKTPEVQLTKSNSTNCIKLVDVKVEKRPWNPF